MIVKVGQKVMYKKWGGNEVKVDGEEWTIVEQKIFSPSLMANSKH